MSGKTPETSYEARTISYIATDCKLPVSCFTYRDIDLPFLLDNKPVCHMIYALYLPPVHLYFTLISFRLNTAFLRIQLKLEATL